MPASDRFGALYYLHDKLGKHFKLSVCSSSTVKKGHANMYVTEKTTCIFIVQKGALDLCMDVGGLTIRKLFYKT